MYDQEEGRGFELSSRVNLVDLAGSERFSYRTKDVASFESRNINLSLHHLEHVVRTLCETAPALSPRKHVPYRNSVLTSMLRDSLGGNCRTALVATLAADAEHARESAATLRFARRCGAVKAVAVQRNLDLDPGEQLVARLREENRTLRAALREADGALTKAADDADRALRRAAAAEAKARDLQLALDGPRGHRAASTSDSDAPPPRASAPSPSQPPPNPRDLLSRGAVVLKHGRTGLQSVQPRFAWVSAERVLRWRRLGDGGDCLCGNQPVSRVIVNLHAIQSTRSRRQRRVDGVETRRHRADAATETATRRWRGAPKI